MVSNNFKQTKFTFWGWYIWLWLLGLGIFGVVIGVIQSDLSSIITGMIFEIFCFSYTVILLFTNPSFLRLTKWDR